MTWKLDVALVAAALVLGQLGFFYLASYRCELGVPASPSGLKALVVSDVHLLGKRRRTLVERVWIDMQITTSLQAAVRVHRPDVVLVLGDQLDEGGFPTTDADYEAYIARFKAAFAPTHGIETVYLIGNHDSAFGRFLTPAAIVRHERAFGVSNYVTTVKGHKIIRLNTMALDADVANVEVQAQAASFLETLTHDDALHEDQSVVLLSHFPLFREDDLACGPERAQEQGHITYEHPSFAYETHHHVLSKQLSRELLRKLRPNVVLSGHTHAWCAFEHQDGAAEEFTVPAFSWGQRPDPSYAVLVLPPAESMSRGGAGAHVSRCALPREPAVFALYGVVVSVLLLRLLWRCVMMSRRPVRLQHHQKKLK